MKNLKKLWVILLIVVSLAAVGTGVSVGAVGAPWNSASHSEVAFNLAPPTPDPTDSLALVILGLDELAWTDAYDAASSLETEAQAVMNAVFLIRRGSIQDVVFNPDQLAALRDRGLKGLVLAVDRYTDLLAILELTQAQLDAWEVDNPQSQQCYLSYQALGCPPL